MAARKLLSAAILLVIHIAFVVAGLLALRWGILAAIRGEKDAYAAIVVGALVTAFGVFLVVISWAPRKPAAQEIPYFHSPTENRRFGFLLIEAPASTVLLFLGGMLLVLGYPLGSAVLWSITESEGGWLWMGRVIFGGASALVLGSLLYAFVVGAVKERVASRTRPRGLRESKGVVWDIAAGEVIAGEFELQLKSGRGSRKQIESMTAKDGATRQHFPDPPELHLTIGRVGGWYQVIAIRLGGMVFIPPTSKEPTSKPAGMDVVIGGEIVNTDPDAGSLWGVLRRIGAIVSAIPGVRLPVTVALAAQKAGEGDPLHQGSGLTPGMVGYAVGSVVGAGAVGAVVGAAVGGLDPPARRVAPTQEAHERAIRAFVYGDPERPGAESLRRIVEEFKWKLQAPA